VSSCPGRGFAGFDRVVLWFMTICFLSKQIRPTIGQSRGDHWKRGGRWFLTIDFSTVNVFPETREVSSSESQDVLFSRSMMTFALVVREFIPQ